MDKVIAGRHSAYAEDGNKTWGNFKVQASEDLSFEENKRRLEIFVWWMGLAKGDPRSCVEMVERLIFPGESKSSRDEAMIGMCGRKAHFEYLKFENEVEKPKWKKLEELKRKDPTLGIPSKFITRRIDESIERQSKGA